ncbi:MAG TPA: SPFH domain-containing protein [Phycisphaerae bacterium]|nr:SPFH domain-containing protein [Phycisphaerae bacterium]
MTGIDRRGEVVALVGGLLSLIGAVILAILAIWSEGASIWMASFQMLGGVGIWLLTLIQLHQQRLVREEQLEVAELDRQRQEKLGGAQTIFDEEDLDQMEKLAMGRRLRTIERYLIPAAAIIIALFHLAAGASVFPWRFQFPPIARANPKVLAEYSQVLVLFVGGIAFACFMASRYALGMSRLPDWGALRAGGDFMFGSSAICLLTAVALLCVISGMDWVQTYLAMAIGILLILLAAEALINFVLDFYRPRVPGLAQRPFYDSRLLGIFSEPGGILRSLANAVDYQFGFKVSETWFYKLLGKAVLPLLLVQVAIIFALTCISVVPPGHKAVIEHNGLWEHKVWVAKPGVHWTWFWPTDRATVIPVERVQRMAIGYEVDEKRPEAEVSGPILWTKKHYKKEYQLLVGDKRASAAAKVPVNLLAINMPVQWRVKDGDQEVIRFYDQSQDVASILESLAYRELTRYAAQADILDLLGKNGIETAARLQSSLQEACDHAGYDGGGLGVQIVHVGIGGIHPPPDEEVARSYEDVVSAYETRDAKILAAKGDAARLRVESAGPNWQKLYDAIVREDQTREASSGRVEAHSDEVDRLLRPGESLIGGNARQIAAEAEKQAIARVFGEMSSSERYGMQLAAYEAAPRVYALRIYLRMVRDGLEKVRKYVIALDDPERVIYRFDLRPPAEFNVTAAELGAMESKGGK